MVLTYDLLDDGHKDDFTMNDFFLFFYQITQMDSMLLWVCTVIDHMTLHRL